MLPVFFIVELSENSALFRRKFFAVGVCRLDGGMIETMSLEHCNGFGSLATVSFPPSATARLDIARDSRITRRTWLWNAQIGAVVSGKIRDVFGLQLSLAVRPVMQAALVVGQHFSLLPDTRYAEMVE